MEDQPHAKRAQCSRVSAFPARTNAETERLQRSAVSPPIAEARTLGPRGARALDVFKVEMTGPDKIEKALRGSDPELMLSFAERVR
jgi:hypothetical protein